MSLLYYLIELNLYLILFYGFYYLFLRNERHFNHNRWFLLGSLISSFLIPLIKLDWLKNDSLSTFSASTTITLNEIVINTQQQHFFIEGFFSFLYSYFWVILYCIGAFAMILKLLISIRSIYKTIKDCPREIKDGYTEVSLSNPDEAFSFGRFLCIGNKSTLPIYRHELAHINQKHYIDLWTVETVSIICWFNPVHLLYRRSIKITHEYLADAEVCTEINAVDYAETLVSNLFQTNTNLLTHSFYTPRNLKNRLIMLKKNTSSKWALYKYSMTLPLCLSFIFISSSAFISKQNIQDLS